VGPQRVRLLVVNAGSSSLKLRLLGGGDRAVADREIELEPDAPIPANVLDGLPRPDAVAHRVVHGGAQLRSAVWIDDGVRARIAQLAELAPLHQPRALEGIDLAARALPGVPAAACFDTAFHATLGAAAATYALPAEWRQRWPLRRFGFHGLSHAYAAGRAAALLDRPPEALRIVSCHLGAGASLAAVAGGVSVDTTMGFTPLEGLVMASRAGSVDPGLLLWLLDRGLAPGELSDALVHRSGLAGLAGTADMRAVLARAGDGDAAATLALDVYVHRLRAGIAAMAAAMGGLDALVFTAGVGERAPQVRAAAAAGLGFLGVALDEGRNAAAEPDTDIGAAGAPVRVLVIHAREDLEIARQVRALAAR
jgi:acetate kinase